MRRHALFLTAILASGAAHADWVPVLNANNNVVTVSYGGGSKSFQESATLYDGRLYPVTRQMLAIRNDLEATINNVVGATITQQGATFKSGNLTGDIHANIQPAGSNTLSMTLDGVSYQARSAYSGKKFGITFTCTNTFFANNISMTGQYGANNGVLLPSVGLTSSVNSSTDCDSNLSWILPVVGDLLVNKATGIIDSRLEDGVRSAMNGVKDKLLYVPDPAWGVGLLRLVPSTMQVTAADGRSFDIGQFIANNLTYLLGNAQIDVQLGQGLKLAVVPGTSSPPIGNYEANFVTLNITSPSATFSVKLSQKAYVDWQWRCPANTGVGGCSEP
jgi:hypothetical protein